MKSNAEAANPTPSTAAMFIAGIVELTVIVGFVAAVLAVGNGTAAAILAARAV